MPAINNYFNIKQHCLRLMCSLSLILFISGQVVAQRWEAENASLSGGAGKQECSSCSGGQMVAQGEGSLSFSVHLSEAGFYNLYIQAAAPHGDKTNVISINGLSADFFLPHNPQYTHKKLVSTHKLAAGAHTLQIKKSWGWINVDYIELEKVPASQRFDLNQALVTPDPTAEAAALYDFLLDHYGRNIISGVMTLNSLDMTSWLKENTGKEPALLGLDFMHSGRNYSWYNDKEPIEDASTWYARNGIPALMWHWRDPSRQTEEFYPKSTSRPNGTEFDISKIYEEGSAEYAAMLADIDYVSSLLLELQEQGVPVIWRPLHEAAGGWFWWGTKGPEPLKALWQLMWDRMVNQHGLHNLIWVWTREPGDEAWYPGDAYVDIIGRDIYKEGDHSSQAIEFNNLNALYGGRKMIALSETGSFPDVEHLVQDEAAWSWYMPWYGDFTQNSRYNSLDLWKKMFAHDYVLTLDEMPELRGYVRQNPGPGPDPEPTGLDDYLVEKSGLQVYPRLVARELTIKSREKIHTVAVYTLQGALLLQQQLPAATEVVLSLAGVQKGMYLLRINDRQTVRVLKK